MPVRPLAINFHSVRTRLFLLVLLVVVPALAVQVYGAWSDLQQDIGKRKLESVSTIAHAQGDFDTVLGETQTVFADLVRVNDMRSPNNCSQMFTALRFAFERLAPEATNLGLADANGEIYCAINPVQGDKNLSGQMDFQAATQTLDMAMGTYTPNPLNGTPLVRISYPVLSFNGQVQTVIFAVFQTHWLEKWQNENAFPSGTAVTLLGTDGQVLWRTVNKEYAAIDGLNGSETQWYPALQKGEKVVENPDFDGVVRLQTLIPLKLHDQVSAYLHLGYPVAELYDSAIQNLRWKLGLLALVVFLAFILAWWGSETLFLQPLNKLMGVVASVQAGDLSARVSTVNGLDELEQLARSFDQMTDSLQQRESERQESDARFRAMFESSAVGIGIMGLDRKIIDANPAMCKMMGYTLSELVGQTSAMTTHSEDYSKATQLFGELVAGERSFYIDERRYQRKNGELFWGRTTMSIVRDAHGKPLYMVGMVLDVDEERHALAKLQESEARFKSMYENAPIGISLIAPNQKILAVNPALVKISGRSEAELIALGSQAITHPEDTHVGRVEFAEIIQGKRDTYQVEKRYVRPDGRVQWMRQSISAVRDSAGELIYLLAIAEDIDQQKRAVEELRESEARFRSMFDNAAVGVAVMSLDRHISQINLTAVRLTGYTAEEISEIDPSSLAVEEDRLLDRVQFLELVEGKRDQYTIEKRYYRKDGTIFWGRVNFSAVRGADGKPLYTIGMIEDISEEKLASEKLTAQETEHRHLLEQRIAERTEELNIANERLREKAAQDAVTAERTRLARDLHDAVTQTLFSTTLIADVLPDIWEMNPDEGKRRLEEVRQLTRGALAEMRTLLVELRPNALVEVPLPTLLRQLTEALTGRSRINIQLGAEGDRKLPADVQVSLYRIAQEALNNVVKHAKASAAVVTLRLSEPVRLTVADNGVGFDPGVITADHLGLKIMRERADAIGAKLSIYSEPGEGTQISIVWP